MISEAQQDQAALYALDLLSAAEDSAFAREMAASAELQTLVRELREAGASLALAVPSTALPSPALKQHIMQQIAESAATPEPENVIRPPAFRFGAWLPWAIAAGFMIFCGVLALERAQLRQRLAEERETAPPLLVALSAAEGAPAKARAVVAWDAAKQIGTLKIADLSAAEAGKDYQLWAVDAAHKDPINAGIVRVDAKGAAQVQFRPTQAARQVKAFAISLERAGGVPKKEGPILLIGTA